GALSKSAKAPAKYSNHVVIKLRTGLPRYARARAESRVRVLVSKPISHDPETHRHSVQADRVLVCNQRSRVGACLDGQYARRSHRAYAGTHFAQSHQAH